MIPSVAPQPPGEGRIARAFAEARAHGRCCLIPYITAGDPDLATTEALMLALDKAGVKADRGFVVIDNQSRTNVKTIFAIGSI